LKDFMSNLKFDKINFFYSFNLWEAKWLKMLSEIILDELKVVIKNYSSIKYAFKVSKYWLTFCMISVEEIP
jgi:hypothetical protein